MLKLNINDQDALNIKNKIKRIIILVNNQKNKFEENEVIAFTSENLGTFYAQVKEINHYDSLEKLLFLEGTRYTTSFTYGINKVNESVNVYEDEIKKSGVYALHIEYLYSENMVWEELYEKAKNIRNSKDVSGMISAGGVGAAILTKNHHIYTGVCIDTASSLGMCAERNAIANMLTNGESEIVKLVCIDSKGNVGFPCGACREYLMQLSKNSKNIEILKNNKTKETIRLEELIPKWWGYDRV